MSPWPHVQYILGTRASLGRSVPTMSRGYHPRWNTTTPSPSMGSDLDEISQRSRSDLAAISKRSRLLRPSSKVHTVSGPFHTHQSAPWITPSPVPRGPPPGTRGWHPPTLIEELPLPPWERGCWFCGLCGEWSESPIASTVNRHASHETSVRESGVPLPRYLGS